jgi:hypothetical protein
MESVAGFRAGMPGILAKKHGKVKQRHLIPGRTIASANGVGVGHVFAVFRFAVMAAGQIVVVAGGSVHPDEGRGTSVGGRPGWRLLDLGSKGGDVGESCHCENEGQMEKRAGRDGYNSPPVLDIAPGHIDSILEGNDQNDGGAGR